MDISDAIAAIDAPVGQSYSLLELGFATKNFSQIALLGKGSNNSLVYHANFSMWEKGVVKKLNTLSLQDFDAADFAAQLALVWTLGDEHLTSLYGYCFEGDNRFLVYEYAPLGSLYDVLYGRKGLEGAEPGPVLTWSQRAKIAYGAAKGLEYLHEKVEPSIVHGEVRSSNVLLFYDFESKIGDFNLPRAMSGEITKKSDVYNFGVVLLELLTGRKAVDDTLPEEQQDLVTWASPYLSADTVEQIVDPKLNGDFPPKAVAKVAALAGLCIQEEPDFRPNMTIMVRALEPLQEQPKAPDVVEIEGLLKVYTLEDINTATDKFSQMTLVAKTPYCKLYDSIFSNGRMAAIKKLDTTSSAQVSDADFIAQLKVLSQIKHEHFTELLGYCMEEDSRFLVYELATSGSLHDILYGRKGVYGAEPGPVIPWAQREKIAYGAAKGLEYLHDVAKPSIVHGDVRSSNVLLFEDVFDDKPKIADFNLTNALLGAEVQADGDDTEKSDWRSDVYNFGVVLLELVTGRKPVDDTMPEGEQDLITWAGSYICADNVEQIVDPRLDGDFPLSAVAKVAETAWLCVSDTPDLRPSMSTVVETLETLVNA